MTTLEQQLLDVVKTQLPEAQAQATKELIDDYIMLKEECPRLEELNDGLACAVKEYIGIVKKKDEEIEEFKNREKNILKQEKELKLEGENLNTEKNKFKILILEERLDNYEKADMKIERFFDRVFKNYTFSKKYNEQLAYSQDYISGNHVNSSSPHTIERQESAYIEEN